MKKIAFIASFVLTLSSQAHAAFEQCLDLFPARTPPQLASSPISDTVRPLCFESFAVLHDGIRKTPVYSVEKLNRAILLDSKDEKRTDKFYEEARLPSSQRAKLEDYKSSGFDRGHMVPAAGRPTPAAMAQSFSLANMVPQAPQLNRGYWAKLEDDTRKYAMRAGSDVYVFTGPLYYGNPKTIGSGKVAVPDFVYKLVFDPSGNRAWVYFAKNEDSAVPSRISYQEFVSKTGLNLLGNANPKF